MTGALHVVFFLLSHVGSRHKHTREGASGAGVMCTIMAGGHGYILSYRLFGSKRAFIFSLVFKYRGNDGHHRVPPLY